MMRQRIRHFTMLGVLSVFMVGCGGPSHHHKDQPLPPPPYAGPIAVTAIEEGNRLFAQRELKKASKKYETAIQAQSSLGEAHYNLGLALHKQGRYAESRPHFVKAAKLEPGNSVIRNAPPFRSYRTNEQHAGPEPSGGHSGHSH
ncbi:MAG: tetratricopeptide repeat protein [Nitrospirae bacterium]|nr:tetratricopeptide repeat protein [Nitrospirota bacterium]